MKNYLKFLFVVLFLSATTTVTAQFTSQQAIDLVLNQLLSGELDQVDVFMIDVPKSGQNNITLPNGDIVPMAYSSNWVFFVDDIPYANWAHDCRYIFVDEASGNYQIVNEDFLPVDLETAYTCISEMPRPEAVDMPVNPNATINGLNPSSNLYAVIINGFEHGRYWRDISAIYCTLLDVYGYTKENIFVHYVHGYSTYIHENDFDNDGEDDIDYDSYKATVLHTFSEMAGVSNTSPEIPELGPEDGLFIFVNDHGYMENDHSYVVLPNNESLADWELAEALEEINCGQIIAILEPCFVGGFKTELSDYINYNVSCKNRSIQTACDETYSYGEVWLTTGSYNEFVFYWTAAARGYFPAENEPWNLSFPVESMPFNDLEPNWNGLHPEAYDPDLNGDGFVQMQEAFNYANNFDTWTDFGFWWPYGVTPDDIHVFPQEFTDISFNEDLLFLLGLTGHVSATQSVEGRNYLIGGDIIVENGCNLTIGNGGSFYFGNEYASLASEANSSITMNKNISFYGQSSNELTFEGLVQFGNSHNFGEIEMDILNPSQQSSIINGTFDNTTIYNLGYQLGIAGCTSTDGIIRSFTGSVSITTSDFTNTWLYFDNLYSTPEDIFSITNCNIDNSNTYSGIELWNYGKYFIENNDISVDYSGIMLFNSGYGTLGNQNIIDNHIHNCGNAGILSYNSIGSIAGNNIHNNAQGVKFLNNSNIAFLGNASATSPAETQQLRDNAGYELYASTCSFPWYFRANVIIDDDNNGVPQDPMIYYNIDNSGGNITLIDVRYNCWEDIPGSFDPLEDLHPNGYIVNPTWCPGDDSFGTDIAEQLYLDGCEQFENEEYIQAKVTFQLLIGQFPDSKYAEAAMKDLISLEQFAGNDYSDLQNYFLTNDSIQADSILMELSQFLANRCDIKLENWAEAISYYESIINNPENTEDSIFAIIDLGYVYFLMANSGMKDFTYGQLTQYIPQSKEQFIDYRNYLLSLIPKESTSHDWLDESTSAKIGELIQNVPNPFSDETHIWYKLQVKADVNISVYNHLGQLMDSRHLGMKEEGGHIYEFDGNNLQAGIYFYSLYLDGIVSDSKKMVVVR